MIVPQPVIRQSLAALPVQHVFRDEGGLRGSEAADSERSGVQTKTLKQQHYQIIKVSVLPFQSRRSPRLADTARQAGCADAVVDRHWLV